MLPETHRFVIQHALQLRRKNFKGYEKEMIRGCTTEDFPNLSLKAENFQLFGWDHFYSPKKGGYFSFFGNAKKKGVTLFKRAVKLYKQKKFKEAFYTLGRSAHYLHDIASPAHTKLLFHLAEDDFEKYVEQNLHKFKFKLRSRLVRPMRPSTCFEMLAIRSHRVRYTKQNYVLGLFWDIFKKRKQSDPKKKLNRLSRKLIKYCIIYTIALLNAFNRRIVRHNLMQQMKLKENLLSKERELVKKIKKKSKRLVS
jgi:hypothetical protein